MENILKLVVKKEIYDKLYKGEQDYIYVDATNYWIKRLAVNPNIKFDELKVTKEFRQYESLSITSVKNNATYPIKKIIIGHENMNEEGEDTGMLIFIDNGESEVDIDECEEITDEQSLTTDLSEFELKDTETAPLPKIDVDKKSVVEVIPKQVSKPNEVNNVNIEEKINEIIDFVGTFDKVAIVNSPLVIITSNGKIFGSKSQVNANNEQEIRFNIGSEIVSYDTKNDNEFLAKVEKYLTDLSKDNYLFILKNGCKLIKDGDTVKYLKLKMTIKRIIR